MALKSGGCQCGRVRYTVEIDLDDTITCNCSRCGRLGSVLSFAPAEAFTLLAGEDALTEYRFNTGKIVHAFCATCGIESFARGAAPNGAQMAAVNVRCLDGIDVFVLAPTQVNGAAF